MNLTKQTIKQMMALKTKTIGDMKYSRKTRSKFKEQYIVGHISLIEPTSIKEALLGEGWIVAMQEELNQFKKNDVYELIPRPKVKHTIGTKWMFRNKLNVRKKNRLLSQGYNQHVTARPLCLTLLFTVFSPLFSTIEN